MLSAQGIERRYGRGHSQVRAVDGVSLDLRPGQRLAVVGRSGSGKSTLARVLALLEAPDAGSVSVDGTVVTAFGMRTPRPLRRAVQLIWQSPRLACDPRLRIREIVLEPLIANGLVGRARDERDQVVRHWAARLGIADELLERFPHEVSDGQLQRACLARSLALEPRYLICDEMSSMLDVSTQAALLEVVAEEQRRRDMGVLLVTHDHILADHWCHDRIELVDGRVKDARESASALSGR
ncbi:MAG: ATP-binding cassette domain-containing protein [Dehalococcoidia bacterium]|nr:ATP-binding cassette domain-containing protein [Dehalococcoidia bacterium]